MPVRRAVLALLALSCLVTASGAGGQTPLPPPGTSGSQLSDRGPRFIATFGRDLTPLDVTRVAVLTRRVALDLTGTTIPEALNAIAAQTHVRFAFSQDALPTTRVSLRAADITIAAALTEILLDTDLDVHVAPSGLLTLFPKRGRTGPAEVAPTGRIDGHISNQASGEPVPLASVVLDPPGTAARTDAQGNFVFRALAAGSYHVSVRALGYASTSQAAVVYDDSVTRVDVRLVAVPAPLSEVVTTMTGDQRKLEMGTTLATIGADSLAAVTPITSLTDLIAGRAPGVEVLESSGLAGSGPRIRIRGANSATQSNDPIVYMDGIRVDGSPGQSNVFGLSGQLPLPTNGFSVPSRLNDLNPDEIETIEIVKGPAAATLYGTDAANGVIVITTKAGHVGTPHWDVSASQGITTIPTHFPENYYAWGHTTDGTRTPVQCLLFNPVPFTPMPNLGDKSCVTDSITHYDPLNHASTSVFGTGYRSLYEAQLSGGAPQVRYFLSGGLTDETGPLQMPAFEQTRLEMARGVASIPGDQVRPNALQQVQTRVRLTFTPRSNVDLALSAGFVRSGRRAPNELDVNSGYLASALYGPGIRDSVYGYRTALSFIGAHSSLPGNVFSEAGTDSINRLTASVAATWRPRSWLSAHGTLGLDYSGTDESILQRPEDDQDHIFTSGFRSDVRGSGNVYSSDLGATATVPVTWAITSRTSIGTQLTRSTAVATGVSSNQLLPGNGTIDGAQFPSVRETLTASATLGTYVEQTFSLHDQLFVTGATRIDAGSAFGSQYAAEVYPKASVSWLVLPQSQTLRLRAAYGASGVQPHGDARLLLFQPNVGEVGGTQTPIVLLQQFGNPTVRPERTAEFETGFDANLDNGRFTIEATYFNKHSRDALIDVTLPSSLGLTTREENVGAVRNRGAEALVSARILESPTVGWDIRIAGSLTRNTLLAAGEARGSDLGFGTLLQPGFPLFGNWTQQLRYADANHDGIIEPSEVTLGDHLAYAGPRIPPYQADLTSGLTLFHGRVRVTGTLSYQGGNRLFNVVEAKRCEVRFSDVGAQECNVPGSSLALQARQVAQGLPTLMGEGNSGFYEPGWFVRFRELAVTYDLSSIVTRLVRARTGGVTLSVRNLALWTAYTGIDPESTNSYGAQDLLQGAATSPPPRYWLLRVNLGL